MAHQQHLHIFFLLYLWFGSAYGAASYSVDLSGPGCDNNEGYYLKDMNDVATVFAMPQYNAMATRDHCDVTLRADQGRRIQYMIDMIKFSECGVEIFIFHSDIDANPKYYLRCTDNSKPPIYDKSNLNYLRIRVRKATPESRIFEFRLRAKNDLGPTLEYDKASEQFYQEPLEPGAVAGIAVAGAIIVIALILVAIYLCFRGRVNNQEKYGTSSTHGESSVYTSGTSEVFFAPGSNRNPKGKYGSMEDIRSSASSQNKEGGGRTNNAYTPGPDEKRSERQASVGRSRGKNGISNEAFIKDEKGRGAISYEEETRGSLRKSRKDAHDAGATKQLKSAMKKPSESEMNKVNTQPNGILKTRTHSPNRSQTSSNEGSGDTNTMIHGYSHVGKEHPNVKHKPVIERRRSRSGTRSHRSGSSGHGSVRGKRSHSEEKKPPKGGRMYDDVFIDDRKHRSRSSGRRAHSAGTRSQRSDLTDRTSDSLESESSTTSHSRKVSMNPGGKRVHIKGEETDI